MKTKLLFLLFFTSLPSFAQYTLIPDPKFENKLIDLGIDSGTLDGRVLTSSIASVTDLNISVTNISDLTGIQDFLALQTLHCTSLKNLTHLDLSKNTALISLSCGSNNLTNLDLTNNTALTSLRCFTNRLTSLNLSKNTALTYLDCSYNQLTILDISNNTALTNVTCYHNSLTNLNTSKNTALKGLDCSMNKLTNLDLSKNPALSGLNCSDNKITSLDVANNLVLLGLTCSANLLTSIDVSKNVILTEFEPSHNPLKNIDVSNNFALTILDCSIDQLTSLDVSKNINLKNLACSSNQLTNLDVSANTFLTSLECYNNQLTRLNLKNGNNINFLTPHYFTNDYTNNPNLSCIQVDDLDYSNSNWSTFKDATASYSTSCSSLGIAETVFDKMAVYPNPTKGELHIDNAIVEKANVYDSLGKLVTTKIFAEGSINNTINLAGFPKGIYYIYFESKGATVVKKTIIE